MDVSEVLRTLLARALNDWPSLCVLGRIVKRQKLEWIWIFIGLTESECHPVIVSPLLGLNALGLFPQQFRKVRALQMASMSTHSFRYKKDGCWMKAVFPNRGAFWGVLRWARWNASTRWVPHFRRWYRWKAPEASARFCGWWNYWMVGGSWKVEVFGSCGGTCMWKVWAGFPAFWRFELSLEGSGGWKVSRVLVGSGIRKVWTLMNKYYCITYYSPTPTPTTANTNTNTNANANANANTIAAAATPTLLLPGWCWTPNPLRGG